VAELDMGGVEYVEEDKKCELISTTFRRDSRYSLLMDGREAGDMGVVVMTSIHGHSNRVWES
jgi:hypothetical protein